MDGIFLYRNGLTLDIIKDKYPWLLEAEIENAIIGQNEDGFVWYGGDWKNGTFASGAWGGGTFWDGIFDGKTWKNGVFYDGTFAGETWERGGFHGGTFAGGIWEGGWFDNKGIFAGGTWKDGYWENGTWEGGTWIKGKIWDEQLNDFVESDVNPNEYKNK
jgi:hypothetical protein